MKKIFVTFIAFGLISLMGCKKFLDVNTNPNAPQQVEANLYLSPLLHWMATGPQVDGVVIGRYNQNWAINSNLDNWDRMGHAQNTTAPDNGGQLWRTVYFDFGQNLVDMTRKAEAEQRWDLLGVAQILKAWGWLQLTSVNGEIIIKEAIDASKTKFKYDTQEFAYQEVFRLLDLAIVNLARTDGAVSASYLGKTDIIYKGNRALWTKFAYGLKAMGLNHFSNKTGVYKPEDVIAAVDLSFQSNADDPLLAYTGTANDDINYLAGARNNITNVRQTNFILNLMNGNQFGGVVDPRLTRMLSPSPDGQFRGIDPVTGVTGFTTSQIPNNLWGYTTQAAAVRTPARYIFSTKSKIPVISYAQLQFVKAEAAYKSTTNLKSVALAAYRNGISASIDFVNARNSDDGQLPTQISTTEKNTFLASPAIIPALATDLTLSQIMCQKYIAQWGWGHLEQWMDLRRYHYVDTDPITAKQVFLGFAPPTNLFPDNYNKYVYRIRPRYNSEYVWNREALDAIGGLALDYQTVEMWITKP